MPQKLKWNTPEVKWTGGRRLPAKPVLPTIWA
jgi:hypothetical protein